MSKNYQICTVGQNVPENEMLNVFLAGPIERRRGEEPPILPRWRDEARILLSEKVPPSVNYRILNPEWDMKPEGWSYLTQVMWEVQMLNRAHCILCWIPRRLPELPAFTTNIEVGEWLTSSKLVVGAPPDTPHTKYIKTRRMMSNRPWYTSLKECCDAAATHLVHTKGILNV